MDGIYTRGPDSHSVIATDAPIRHRGGVALFYRSEPHFVVEAVEKFGPNVLGFQLATGARQWYIIGLYIAPPLLIGNPTHWDINLLDFSTFIYVIDIKFFVVSYIFFFPHDNYFVVFPYSLLLCKNMLCLYIKIHDFPDPGGPKILL